MTSQVKCPFCSSLLYLPSLESELDNFIKVVCVRCKRKYAVLHGRASTFRGTLSQRDKYSVHAWQKWNYELGLITNFGIENIQFSIPGYNQSFFVEDGDKINVLYPVRRDTVLKYVACIQNITTDKTCIIFHGRDALFFRFYASVLPTALAITIASILPSSTGKVLLAVSLPFNIAAGMFAVRATNFKEHNKNKLAQLFYEQKLLKEGCQLDQQLQELSREQKANQKIVEQLYSLKQEIVRVQADTYKEQIAILSKAINVLEKQVQLAKALVKDYSYVINVLTIEYKTSRLVEQLPKNIISQIPSKRDELETLEAKKADLISIATFQKIIDESALKEN